MLVEALVIVAVEELAPLVELDGWAMIPPVDVAEAEAEVVPLTASALPVGKLVPWAIGAAVVG